MFLQRFRHGGDFAMSFQLPNQRFSFFLFGGTLKGQLRRGEGKRDGTCAADLYITRSMESSLNNYYQIGPLITGKFFLVLGITFAVVQALAIRRTCVPGHVSPRGSLRLCMGLCCHTWKMDPSTD